MRPKFRVRADRLAGNIWLRLLHKLRARMEHALLPSLNTGAGRPIQLTNSSKEGICPNPQSGLPKSCTLLSKVAKGYGSGQARGLLAEMVRKPL
jgi:hypothetical protein